MNNYLTMAREGKVDFTKSGKPVKHGTPNAYNNHKCSCPECKKAWAAYMGPRIQAIRDRIKASKKKPNVKINL